MFILHAIGYHQSAMPLKSTLCLFNSTHKTTHNTTLANAFGLNNKGNYKITNHFVITVHIYYFDLLQCKFICFPRVSTFAGC